MQPVPKRKIENLISEVIGLAGKESDNREFLIKKIERDVKNLIKSNIDLGECYMVLGMLAALENRISDSDTHFKTALKHSPNESVIYNNYAVTLLANGLFSQAVKWALEGHKKFASDARILSIIVFSLINSGCFEEALIYAQKYKALVTQEQFENTGFDLKLIESFINATRAHNIMEKDLTRLSKAVIDYLISKGVMFNTSRVDYGPDGFVFEYILNASAKEVETLQEGLNDYLWEKGFFELFGDSVIVDLVPLNPDGTLEGELKRMEEDIHKNPDSVLALDKGFMNRISDLVREVKL